MLPYHLVNPANKISLLLRRVILSLSLCLFMYIHTYVHKHTHTHTRTSAFARACDPLVLSSSALHVLFVKESVCLQGGEGGDQKHISVSRPWQACTRALSLALLRSHIQKLSPSHPPLSFACSLARSPSLACVPSRRCPLPLSPPLPPARSHTDPTHSNTHKFTHSTATSYPKLWRIQYRTHKQSVEDTRAANCNTLQQHTPGLAH